jgi:pyruvate,water dikinase
MNIWRGQWQARKSTPNNETLKGLSGSSGFAMGTVRVISGPDEFGKLKSGDVLVCPYTDPAWTPLFTLACAVVSDTGGPLSHAAIVAREYGIPAVLGTQNATLVLKDGEQISVDGNSGEVRAIKYT